MSYWSIYTCLMNFNKKSEIKGNKFIKIRKNKKEIEKIYKYYNL